MAPTFASLLSRYREACDLAVNELARRAGVDPSYISRLERGERRPPSRLVVVRLAATLGLDPLATDCLLVAAGYAPAWLVPELVLVGTLRQVAALRMPQPQPSGPEETQHACCQ